MNAPTDLSHRDIRQRELVPPEKLAVCQALVIGVGAIGRQVALQLAAMGTRDLILVDHDHVAVENLAPQGYLPSDLGMAKVEATGRVCREMYPEIRLRLCPERFRRSSARQFAANPSLAVFACVDSITTRKLLWESLRSQAALFIDGRMSAEVIRVLAADHPTADDYYPTTLFASDQAYAGSCTAKSTIYSASIAAGLMVCQFTRWLRGMAIERDITLNLLASELSVA